MTEPVDASPDRATGDSGVSGSRRDAGVPSGSSTPEVSVPDRPAAGDPTTSNLSDMVSATEEPTRPDEVEKVTNSGQTDVYSPTGTAEG